MSGWGGFTRTKHTSSPSRLSECGDLRTSRTLSYNDEPQPLRGAGVAEAWKEGGRHPSHGLGRFHTIKYQDLRSLRPTFIKGTKRDVEK